MTIGAVCLSFTLSVICTGYAVMFTGIGLGMALAVYSMAGSSTLMTLTLVNGILGEDVS